MDEIFFEDEVSLTADEVRLRRVEEWCEAALIFASLREGGGIFAENDGRSMRSVNVSSSVISVIKDRFGQFV